MRSVASKERPPELNADEGRREELLSSIDARTRSVIRARLVKGGVNPQDADDIAQETLVAMVERAGDYRRELGSLEEWASGFAWLNARSWIRRNGYRSSKEVPLEWIEHVAERSIENPLISAVAEALTKIGEDDRNLLRMKYIEGRSSDELAEMTGMSSVAIRKRISRAVESIRKSPALREAVGFTR